MLAFNRLTTSMHPTLSKRSSWHYQKHNSRRAVNPKFLNRRILGLYVPWKKYQFTNKGRFYISGAIQFHKRVLAMPKNTPLRHSRLDLKVVGAA